MAFGPLLGNLHCNVKINIGYDNDSNEKYNVTKNSDNFFLN